MQILRLDCQLAEKIRFIGIVGNLDDPCFYVFFDRARRLLIEDNVEHSRLFETLKSDR